MAKNNDKYIEVDGVVYDIGTGRVVADKIKQPSLPKHNNTVLDLRTPHNIVASNQNAIKQREVQSNQRPQHKATTRAKALGPRVSRQSRTKPKPARNIPVASKATITSGDTQSFEYLDAVLFRGVFPKSNFKLWQLSLVRTIFSPQTWLLLSLPLIILQIRVIKHYTLNETIQKAKSFVAPDRYDQVVLALAIVIVAFFVGVIIRSCITATGISLRLREIDNRPIKMITALRSAMHSIIRQALNYLIHLVVILAITYGLVVMSINLYTTTSPLFAESRYHILAAVFLLWLIILILLYAKHWLQVGLLSRSSKTTHIQIKSIKLLFTTTSANIVSGLTGVFLIVLCYGAIFAMAWFATNAFVSQSGPPAIFVLILISSSTIIILTTLQYIQQNLWARQYYYSSFSSPDKNELLYMEPTRPDSIWPIYVVIALATILMILYFVVAIVYTSRLKGFLANIHAAIPSEVNIVVPVQK